MYIIITMDVKAKRKSVCACNAFEVSIPSKRGSPSDATEHLEAAPARDGLNPLKAGQSFRRYSYRSWYVGGDGLNPLKAGQSFRLFGGVKGERDGYQSQSPQGGAVLPT